jgi:hypothetical protein
MGAREGWVMSFRGWSEEGRRDDRNIFISFPRPLFSGPPEINLITFFLLNIIHNSVRCATNSRRRHLYGSVGK